MALTVSASGTHLERDGVFLPLLIDTAWAALSDATEEDWRLYLSLRRRQGFTAVILTVLPIVHDRIEGRRSRYPYRRLTDGGFDWEQPDDGYFETARRFVEIARSEYRLEVILAVTWTNYLPGTWASRVPPSVVMPPPVLRRHVARVADTFGPLEPVFAIGGDDGYDSPAANQLYHEVIDILRERAPGTLITTHAAPNPYTPAELLDRLDFHLYQSGHNVDLQSSAWEQAMALSAREPRRPVVNVEPPYEWHGMINGSGRWGPAELRCAEWASVLAGAGAGMGYAAHGVWMWATTDGRFLHDGDSLEPATWVEAMSFPGVRDVALLGHLLAAHRLHRLREAQHLLPEPPDAGFRAGAAPDGSLLALYLPYGRRLRVAADLTRYRITAWDLAERSPFVPELERVDGGTVVRPSGARQDALVVAERDPIQAG